MAMSVGIDLATGATPTWTTSVTSITLSLDDAQSGSSEILTPTTTGTAFSLVKSFSIDVIATNGLSMSYLRVGKVAAETTTGTKLWACTSHGTYTQATAAPAATADDNVTAPTINGAAGAVLAIGLAAVWYASGPFNSTGRHGNIVEICVGIDNTNTTAGTGVATPTLQWAWIEG